VTLFCFLSGRFVAVNNEAERGYAHRSSPMARRFWTAKIDHTRLYTAILAIVGLSTCLTIPLGLYVWYLRQTGPAGAIPRPPVVPDWPDWVIPVNAALCAAYLTAIALTLWLRRAEPIAARRVTRVLNYLLLPAAPFGTLVGIYGLLKVDRAEQ
jgi:hypothetical protein